MSETRPANPALLALLSNESEAIREAALSALGFEAGGDDAVVRVLSSYVKSNEEDLRAAAARALETLGQSALGPDEINIDALRKKDLKVVATTEYITPLADLGVESAANNTAWVTEEAISSPDFVNQYDGSELALARAEPIEEPETPADFRFYGFNPKTNVDEVWQVGNVFFDDRGSFYRVKEKFDGGMATVYRIRPGRWGFDIAAKRPQPFFFDTSQQQQNFIDEAQIWIDLDMHPNIVTCYFVRILTDIPTIFLEFVDGGSLREWVRSRRLYLGGKADSIKRMLGIALQSAVGLQFAHRQGLVHQDIKPANIMMTADGIAKVTDFGLARVLTSSTSASGKSAFKNHLVSIDGMTPAYCSPEQACKLPLTSKTDMWSWGVSVIEMFIGDVPSKAGEIADSVLESYATGEFEDGAIPQMPDELIALLRDCFQRDPDQRLNDMQEVANRLADIYRDVTGTNFKSPTIDPELLANRLNNKAISMIELGRDREASEELLSRALTLNPSHLESTYNRGLLSWREGKAGPEELVEKLENYLRGCETDPIKTTYLLGWLRLEQNRPIEVKKLLQSLPLGIDADQDLSHFLFDGARMALVFAREELSQVVKFEQGIASTAPDREVQTARFSPDGRFASAIYDDGWVEVWDAQSGALQNRFNVNVEQNTFVSRIGSDLGFVATCDRSGELKLWEVQNGKCFSQIKIVEDNVRVNLIDISPDLKTVACTFNDGSVALYDLRSEKLEHCRKFETTRNGDGYLQYLPDGKLRFLSHSINADRDPLHVFDLEKDQIVSIVEGTPFRSRSGDYCLACDGRRVLLKGSESLTVVDVESGARLQDIAIDEPVAWATFSPDGAKLSLIKYNPNRLKWMMQVYDVSTGHLIHMFLGAKFSIYHSVQDSILTWYSDHEVRIEPIGVSAYKGQAPFAFAEKS